MDGKSFEPRGPGTGLKGHDARCRRCLPPTAPRPLTKMALTGLWTAACQLRSSGNWRRGQA